MSKNQQANVIYLTIIRDSMSEVVENCEEFEDTKAKDLILKSIDLNCLNSDLIRINFC
jgi:hypothetical protein